MPFKAATSMPLEDFVTEGSIEWTVRAVGRANNVEDLRSTVVAMKGNGRRPAWRHR